MWATRSKTERAKSIDILIEVCYDRVRLSDFALVLADLGNFHSDALSEANEEE